MRTLIVLLLALSTVALCLSSVNAGGNSGSHNHYRRRDDGGTVNYRGKFYYEDLGVPHNASPEQIKAAFREASKKAHPDIDGGSDDAFVRIREAYDVLRVTSTRAAYDRHVKWHRENGLPLEGLWGGLDWRINSPTAQRYAREFQFVMMSPSGWWISMAIYAGVTWYRHSSSVSVAWKNARARSRTWIGAFGLMAKVWLFPTALEIAGATVSRFPDRQWLKEDKSIDPSVMEDQFGAAALRAARGSVGTNLIAASFVMALAHWRSDATIRGAAMRNLFGVSSLLVNVVVSGLVPSKPWLIPYAVYRVCDSAIRFAFIHSPVLSFMPASILMALAGLPLYQLYCLIVLYVMRAPGSGGRGPAYALPLHLAVDGACVTIIEMIPAMSWAPEGSFMSSLMFATKGLSIIGGSCHWVVILLYTTSVSEFQTPLNLLSRGLMFVVMSVLALYGTLNIASNLYSGELENWETLYTGGTSHLSGLHRYQELIPVPEVLRCVILAYAMFKMGRPYGSPPPINDPPTEARDEGGNGAPIPAVVQPGQLDQGEVQAEGRGLRRRANR